MTTVYFERDEDAQDARRDLLEMGVPRSAITLESRTAGGGGFLESLKRFFGADSSENYASGTLMSIDDATRAPQALDIVRRYGGRVQDDAATTTGYARSGDAGTAYESDEQRMRLREERLQVNKQTVSDGEVRLRKEVVTDNQTVDVPVKREQVYIERRGVGTDVSGGDADIADGEEIRVPVMHEEVSVEKRPVVTEEVAIGKRAVEETQTVGGNIRKERARVETEGTVTPETSIDDR